MRQFGFLSLVLGLIGLSWFNLQDQSTSAIASSIADPFDKRPARDVLFIGNSRMYYNDMPEMVRRMADSAGDPNNYRVEMWARPGRSLEDHAGDSKVQALLAEREWDQLIFQAASAEHRNETTTRSFARHGKALSEAARQRGIPAAMIVGWTYGASEFAGTASTPDQYHEKIQEDHRQLVEDTGLDKINAGLIWQGVSQAHPQIRLTSDGNHPTVQGSYLVALSVYAHLSDSDASKVRYLPKGMSKHESELIQAAVVRFYRARQ